MDVAVLADALMALLRSDFDSHEESDVEIDSETDQRFDSLSMLVGHRIYRVQHHAQCLLMAVRLA